MRRRAPQLPHGHGFTAETIMKFAGNGAVPCARLIVRGRPSSGWRSTPAPPGRTPGQLAGEEDSPMTQRDLARAGPASAAHESPDDFNVEAAHLLKDHQ